jgi:hypothetical protein
MAQFIGYLKGNKGDVSCVGTKESGLKVTANGWNIGCEVYISYNQETGKDEIRVYRTSGTNKNKKPKLIINEFTE